MLVGGARIDPSDPWYIREHVLLEILAMIILGAVLGVVLCLG
jgi:hypothetical protein